MVGSTSGAIDLVSPLSNPANGFRKIVQNGNSGSTTFHKLKNLESGTYYWKVQTIDNSYAGSSFSAEGTFTVNPAALITFSNTTHSYTGSGVAPTVVTDPVGLSVDITYDGSATLPTDAGSYAVAATINDVNYSGFASTTLMIEKVTLTAIGEDKTKTYGDENPPLTIAYTGFVGGEDASDITVPTLSTVAVTNSPSNHYQILISGGDGGNNYNLTAIQNGNLVVSRVDLTITTDTQTMIYGNLPPTHTFSYSGFVNNDVSANITEPTISSSATQSSTVGTYAITLNGSHSNNYTLIFVSGTLTINKAELSATVLA